MYKSTRMPFGCLYHFFFAARWVRRPVMNTRNTAEIKISVYDGIYTSCDMA
jgi:hypothetical protein